MTQRPYSLRVRLVALVFSATLLVWAAAGLKSYRSALHEVDEMLDGQMAQSAKLLLAQIRHEESELYQTGMITQVLEEITLHPYERPVDFQVWDDHGKLLIRSANAPFVAKASQPGFFDVELGEQTWRVFAVSADDSHYQVQVAQTLADRQRIALRVATHATLPLLLALPILALIVYLGVRRGLAPLDRLADDVGARDPEHLDSLPEQATPKEARPLVGALNALLARLASALDNERRFTSDAAHELRTPLAAIKVHAQVALASQDNQGRRHALDQVLAGTDRAGRLVEQLLRLARLDPLCGLAEPQAVDLAGLAGREVEQVRLVAEAAGLTLNARLPERALGVSGDADMLALALRNLIENAIRYTPEGGTVTVGADSGPRGVYLWVRDDGPGVPAGELPHLAERFFRGNGVLAEGSGLGLAIVKRVAELHGARLLLENRAEGGFQASLAFRSKVAQPGLEAAPTGSVATPPSPVTSTQDSVAAPQGHAAAAPAVHAGQDGQADDEIAPQRQHAQAVVAAR